MSDFYYDHLNKPQQAVYHALLKGISAISDEFLIPDCDAADLADIFFRFRLDHPEIFWAVGYRCRYYPGSPNLIFTPEYLFRKDKILEHRKAMQARVANLVRPMAKMTELEKEKYVHDFICVNVTYDKLKKPYSHEIIGPLGHGVGVCEGIAKSVKILLDAAGVWNMIALCGNNPDKGIRYRHVWNIVKVGGTFFHLDATFDNTLTAYHPGEEIRYDYFNLGDRQIFRDHEPLIAPAPACPDDGHFYYKEKKLSFTKPEDVYKRGMQAAKKKRVLTFHWRGGYFTKEIFEELAGQLSDAGKLKKGSDAGGGKTETADAGTKKEMTPVISVNFPQAVIRVRYTEGTLPENVTMEKADRDENAAAEL